MDYPVACECGNSHQVSGGLAGSWLDCSCGRRVEIPSLGELRRSVGQAAVSPDLVIETMLAQNELPPEAECVECHNATVQIRSYQVTCEKVEVVREVGGCGFVAYYLVGGVFGLFLGALKNRDGSKVHGRNIDFRLPVRICATCSKNDFTGRELLNRTPIYADLLRKFPNSRIMRVGDRI